MMMRSYFQQDSGVHYLTTFGESRSMYVMGADDGADEM